ncbi:MAG: aminotransferase class I/II-fold pyridoxal phosphate-dependent enzyme [Candidatus Handelsmanbacteria bacterium]|nr:aminotransferase class I/II-fold pyridoxal phosphate-dependent enzyme [Candidatus Handelsmanbacteria bacterium]
MAHPSHHLQTQLIHAGQPKPRPAGAVVAPIYQSATFEYRGERDYSQLRYLRLNNTPNHQALHAVLAAISGAEAALVTASGMAAITTTLLGLLGAGDHLLAQDCLYGGTLSFLSEEAAALGIEVDYIQGNDLSSWARHLRPTTRLLYVETMTNPLLEVPELEAVVGFARRRNLLSVIDNTFASPVNFRPLALGFDLEIHSATKYLNGHSDLVAGCVMGGGTLINQLTRRLNLLGATLDPHACFLLERGLKTLALRMRQHDDNALALARFLEGRPEVARVNYPGLESHPQHQRAQRLFSGCGGVLSFELREGITAADRLIGALELPVSAPSLGGVETLITRPALTSHAGLTPQRRAALGIAEGLVRVAVGIEAAQDLCADFAQALEQL